MGVGALLAAAITFIGLLIKKFLKFAVIMGFQLFFTASTITFVLTFYGFVITTLVFIYNKVSDFFDSFSRFDISHSLVSCFLGLLHCSGIDVAFQTFFSEIYAIFVSILLFRLFKFTRYVLKIISDEMFKLGVLMGL